jgi:hypothetical protein
MKAEIFYSVLKYRHGLYLGESLNAGILFFEPYSGKFTFQQGDLKRISNAYPEVNVHFLKQFIATLKNNVTLYSKENLFKFPNEDLEKFISREILFSDAAGLAFGTVEKISVSSENDYNSTKEYLKQLFLVDSNAAILDKRKRNEEYIIATVNNILKSQSLHLSKKIEKEKEIRTKLIHVTFDFFWKESKEHLVKALAFDLENSILIQNKALQTYGMLDQIVDGYENKNQFSVDFLVAKPGNKHHFRELDNALKVIESANAPVNFSFEENWRDYFNEVANESIELHPVDNGIFNKS